MAFKHYDEVTCDLCKQKIDTEVPWPQLIYPFTDEEISRLMQALQERLPLPVGMLGLRILPVNKYHKFDFCKGCVDGFMPMLEELKLLAFRSQVEELQTKTKDKAKTRRRDDGDEVIEIDLNNP